MSPPRRIISLLCVAYAFEPARKALLWRDLASASAPGSVLILYDYVTPKLDSVAHLLDLSGKRMWPLVMDEIEAELAEAGWCVDVHEVWTQAWTVEYAALVARLDERCASSPDARYFALRDVFTRIAGAFSAGSLRSSLLVCVRR